MLSLSLHSILSTFQRKWHYLLFSVITHITVLALYTRRRKYRGSSPGCSSGKKWDSSPQPWPQWRGRSSRCKGGCHWGQQCRSCQRRSWPGNWRPGCLNHSHTGTRRGGSRHCWAGFCQTSAPAWGWWWSTPGRLRTTGTRQRSGWAGWLPSFSCTVGKARTAMDGNTRNLEVLGEENSM